MNITQLAIEKNRITLSLVVILAISGFFAFFGLPKNQDPGFTIRVAVVTTEFPGASALRVEQLVTDKIEQKIQEIPELDNVNSVTMSGVSVVYAEFKEKYKNMRPLFDKLRRKVEQLEGQLPEGVNQPVVNDEFGDVFGTVYTITGDGFSYAELKDIADDVRDRLLKLPDIAKVEIYGAQSEAIFVDYNNARLAQLGLSPRQLSNALSSVNILSSGGSLLAGKERITLEPTGNFESLEDLRRTVISLPRNGELVYLGDITKIYRDYVDPPTSFVHSNGESALSLAISMREGGNILELGETVAPLMKELELLYPYGIEFTPVAFLADRVGQSVDNFVVNLFQAIGIVILVMFVTLGLRTGLVVSSLIPTTILITFFLMQTFDIGIDQISLAALIISLGLLVDNAIVVSESILVKTENGEELLTAAITSGSELMVPLLVSSLTTAAAFMPIAIAESALGEYTGSIFYVVSLTLLVSWLIALTVIPLLSVWIFKSKKATQDKEQARDQFSSIFYRVYRWILIFFLRFKPILFLLIAGIFYLSIVGLGYVPKVFIPDSTDPIITAKLELPSGTAIETTSQIIEDIEDYLIENFLVDDSSARTEGIKSWVTYIGDGGPRFVLGYDPTFADPSNAQMIITTTRFEEVFPVIAGMEKYILENHPDMEAQVKRLANGPPVSYPIQIRVNGDDIAILDELVSQIKNKLYSLPTTLVTDDWGLRIKKLLVKIDQERALRAGVTNDDVAASLQSGVSGITMTEFREGDKSIPVRLRTVSADRQDVGKLDGLSIYSSSSGTTVPLKQVADISLQWDSSLVLRRDRTRTITINAQIPPSLTANEINLQLNPWLEEISKSWPPGYSYETGGESESSDEANASLMAKLPVGGMVILLLLIMQFNSLRRPAIILTTIPLGIIGITIGLLITGEVFGFFTILGVISLSGIIINNAIVLLDRIKIEIEDNGLDEKSAIVMACQQRLRPIILTMATTIGGMLPLWLGGNVMFSTMAVAIIFGLLFATLLTLLVVPILYSLLFRVRYKGWHYEVANSG